MPREALLTAPERPWAAFGHSYAADSPGLAVNTSAGDQGVSRGPGSNCRQELDHYATPESHVPLPALQKGHSASTGRQTTVKGPASSEADPFIGLDAGFSFQNRESGLP